MISKYTDFEKIKLEDTGLISNNKQDTVYNRLSKNGITNLKDLFELDDLKMINYGNKSSQTSLWGYLQAKGVVKLLRSKYLNEDLPYIDIMNADLKYYNLIVNSNGKETMYDRCECTDLFLSMGISFNFTISMRNSVKLGETKKIFDLFQDTYEGEITIYCNGNPEYERNKRRIGVILEWYYKKIGNLKNDEITNLRELKEKIIKLKDIEERRQEYILAKIQLDSLIYNYENELKENAIVLTKK